MIFNLDLSVLQFKFACVDWFLCFVFFELVVIVLEIGVCIVIYVDFCASLGGGAGGRAIRASSRCPPAANLFVLMVSAFVAVPKRYKTYIAC